METGTAPVARNIALYPVYTGVFHAYFWLPVFFLYFSSHFTLERVLQLEAIYYLGVVLLEVPSGYFSDVIGRRITLLIANAAIAAAHFIFVLTDSFVLFAIAQLFLAAGLAFNSGTDTSFHYDSLAAAGRESEFGDREALASRNAFWGGAAAALCGGLAAGIDFRIAYALSAVAALVCLGIVLAAVEPRDGTQSDGRAAGPLRQLARCAGYLKARQLQWLFAFAVLMTVLNHVPYEFYQPYLRLVVDPGDARPAAAPAVAGLHTALTMLVASWLAAQSMRYRKRVGLANALLSATVLQVLLIGSMAFFVHPIVAVLLLLRSGPRALMTAPLNAAIAPLVGTGQRATYLSAQSLAGRLAFSGLLAGLSVVAGPSGVSSTSLQPMLLICGGIGLAGLGVLAVSRRAAGP